MITARIVGKNGKELKVNGEGEITASIHTHPPIDEEVESIPFRGYFKNSSASTDMRVNGATTNVSFNINADGDFDYYIKNISIKLADAGAALNKFGNLTALTNGVQFKWFSQKVGEVTIHEGIKENLQFFRLSDQFPQIVDLSGAGADAIIVDIDFALLFGLPWGFRLKKGSKDRLSFIIRDNLSVGIDEFNIIAYGIKL